MDDDYSDYQSASITDDTDNGGHSIIPLIIVVMLGVILIAAVLIPMVQDVTQDTLKNEGSSGVELGYVDLDNEHENMTVTVTVDGNNLVYSGDYTKTVPVSDQIVVLTDTTCVYVKNKVIHYFDGTDDHTETSIVLTIIGNTVNSVVADWVYFPMKDGGYSSYVSFKYLISDKIGFDIVGKNVITNGVIIEKDGEKVIYDVKNRY